ncbi:hypothetical protein GRJ2_002432100 [Grus japonensis]|uniref:Uncharacterized protein n=1 Tax=Grus japonensis TaxID=30415 RepID=A0ABC9XQG8_GRUJA
MSEESHLVKHGMQRERKRTKEQHRRGAERRKEVGRKDGSPKRRRPGEQASEMQRERKRTKEQHRRGAERRKEVQRWIWTPSDTDTGGDLGQVGRKDSSPKRWRPVEQAAEVEKGEVPQGASEGRSRVPTSVPRRRCVATLGTGCPFEVPRGMTAAGVSLWTEQMQRERKRTKEQHRRGAERRKEVQRWIWTPSDTDTGGDSGQVGRKDGSPKRRRPGAAGSLGGAKPRADERSEKVRRLRCVATFWTGCPFEVPRGMTAAGVSLWTEQMQRERKRTKEQHRRGAERRKEVLQVRTAAGSISGPSS